MLGPDAALPRLADAFICILALLVRPMMSDLPWDLHGMPVDSTAELLSAVLDALAVFFPALSDGPVRRALMPLAALALQWLWWWCRDPEAQRRLRRRLRTTLLLGMLYTADPAHTLPCGCPSWKAEVFDAIGRKVERVLQTDPAEEWADVHRTDEHGKAVATAEGAPLVEQALWN